MSVEPILHVEAADPPELACVGNDDRRIRRDGVRGNHEIVAADQFPPDSSCARIRPQAASAGTSKGSTLISEQVLDRTQQPSRAASRTAISGVPLQR